MSATLQSSFASTWRDWVGISASVGCAIHCVAMPFVIGYLPDLGLTFLADEAFHKWMFLACVLIGLSAFLPGLKKHGKWSPLAIGSCGLTLIGYAAFGLAGECCAACDLDSQRLVSAESEANCCDNGCCQATQADTDTTADAGTKADTGASDVEPVVLTAPFINNDLLANYASWITPVGGLFLICAHLLNRRFGSVCGCCASIDKT